MKQRPLVPLLKLNSTTKMPSLDYSIAPFTDRDKSAPEMKVHNVLDTKVLDDLRTKKTKIRDEKVALIDTKTGKVYGVKTIGSIVTAESLSNPLNQKARFKPNILDTASNHPEISAEDLENAIPAAVISQIKSNIKKGARDISQEWKNALELVDTAFASLQIDKPVPTEKYNWMQYEELIQYAVRQLVNFRGMSGQWRMTELGLK